MSQRVIKFRVWDAIGEKLLFDVQPFGALWNTVLAEGGTGEQFTGLLDKNGKEIFEGDIVKHPYSRSETGFGVGMIGFDDMYCGFSLQQSNCFYGSGILQINDAKTYEIIGNIHENPRLLKWKNYY